MNDSSAPLAPAGLQADALVAEIGRLLAQRRADVLDAAAREADEVRARAKDKARRQLRRAIDEMRAMQRQRTRQVQAELETAVRRRASQQAQALLDAALPRVGDALRRRWTDATARARWIDALVVQARARLREPAWVVHHPAGWAEADAAALRASLHAHGVADAQWHGDDTLDAGLVIVAGGARLDGTPRALLADAARLAAMLLAALEEQAARRRVMYGAQTAPATSTGKEPR